MAQRVLLDANTGWLEVRIFGGWVGDAFRLFFGTSIVCIEKREGGIYIYIYIYVGVYALYMYACMYIWI